MKKTINHGVTSLSGYIWNTIPAPKLGEYYRRGGRKSIRVSGLGIVRLCLLEMKGKLHP